MHQAPKHRTPNRHRWLWFLIGPVLIGIVAAPFLLLFSGGSTHTATPRPTSTSTTATERPAYPVSPTMWQAPVKPKPPVHHVKPKPPVHHRVTARAKTYTVKTGDTLWAIAQHVYHNPLKFERLYQLNKSVIGANPNIIHTGEVLHL